MKKLAIPLTILAIVGVILAWWLNPANVVKRRTQAFFATAEVPASMTDLARNTRGPNLAEYLAPNVTIDAPESVSNPVGNSLSRDSFAAVYSAAARYCRQISLEEPEFDSVEVNGDEAVVTFRIDAIVELPDRRPVDGIQNATLTWNKTDTGWLLSKAAWTESSR